MHEKFLIVNPRINNQEFFMHIFAFLAFFAKIWRNSLYYVLLRISAIKICTLILNIKK
jgi:hypothetical protein